MGTPSSPLPMRATAMDNMSSVHMDKESKEWILEKTIEGIPPNEAEKWMRDQFNCHDNDLTLRTVVNTPLDKDENAMIHKAATHNHTGLVTWLIENGADFLLRNRMEATALHCAASNGCTSVLELLLSVITSSQVEERDYYGHTPLHLAVKNHHTEAVQTLLRANANPKTKTRGQKGVTALHLACAFGYDDIVEVLLDSDLTLFSMKDDEGMNPFLRSLCIETLPVSGPEGDVYVRTPKQKKVDLQALIRTWIFLMDYDINACVRSTSNQKRNMMHLCSEFQNAEFVQLISMMVNSDHVSAAAKLLAEPDKDKATPLHIAVNMFNTHNNSVTYINATQWETKLQLKNEDQTRTAIDNSMTVIESILNLLDAENCEEHRNIINLVDRKGNSPMHMLLLSLLRQQVTHQDTLEKRQENMAQDDGMFIFEPLLRQQYQCYQKIIDFMTKSGVDMHLVNENNEPIDSLIMLSVQNMKSLNRLLQSNNMNLLKSPRSMRLSQTAPNPETIQGVSPKLVVGLESPNNKAPSPLRQSSKNLIRKAIKSTKKFVNKSRFKRTNTGTKFKDKKKNPKGNHTPRQHSPGEDVPSFDTIEVQSEDEGGSSTSDYSEPLSSEVQFISISGSSASSPSKGSILATSSSPTYV